jgi:hypothetical protein
MTRLHQHNMPLGRGAFAPGPFPGFGARTAFPSPPVRFDP